VKLQPIPVVYFEEGLVVVAHCVPLDVSSCGKDLAEARLNIRDAIAGFLSTCEEMGTLEDVLEESGFVKQGEDWVPPVLIRTDRVDVLASI